MREWREGMGRRRKLEESKGEERIDSVQEGRAWVQQGDGGGGGGDDDDDDEQ